MKILTFDLETIPDESRWDVIEPIIIEKLKTDKPELLGTTTTDPIQIQNLHEALQAEIDRRMSLVPEYCQVACLGYAINEEVPRSGLVGETTQNGNILTEIDLLKAFWAQAKTADTLVGYNVLNFDLQVIRARSAHLGVAPTRNLWNVKPWEDTVVDVYAKRYAQGSKHVAGYKLEQIARVEQVPIPEWYANHPALEGFSGANVYTAWQTGDFESIKLHNELDIILTRELARKWGGYWLPQLFAPWDGDWDYDGRGWVGEIPVGWG